MPWVVHEAAISSRHFTSFIATLMRCAVKVVYVEAIFGDFLAEILLRHDDIPKFVDVVASWTPSSHSHDGNTARHRRCISILCT